MVHDSFIMVSPPRPLYRLLDKSYCIHCLYYDPINISIYNNGYHTSTNETNHCLIKIKSSTIIFGAGLSTWPPCPLNNLPKPFYTKPCWLTWNTNHTLRFFDRARSTRLSCMAFLSQMVLLSI